MKILYFDCFAGISGDMTLGAFLDLGVDYEQFLGELSKLNIGGFKIDICKMKKNGIEGTDVDVIVDDQHYSHDNHRHPHRSLEDIEKIINDSDLDEEVKTLSKVMFMKVAQAEAKIHGMTIDEIYFHEVGVLESIIDIVGATICMNLLDVDKVISSSLHTGTGFVQCQHGQIPIPDPVTVEILRESAVPIYSTGVKNELVTPTGAAIIATLAEDFGDVPEMKVNTVGYGTGKRDMEMPYLLKITLGEKN